VFYTLIFVVIVYKIIKKVFVKITGWKRWWKKLERKKY
jgi:hypothetical protein